MVAYVTDRVCETTTTTGTGNLTIAGAITGFQSFSSAGVATGGSNFYYLIEAVDSSGVPAGDWEVGIGHFATTTTLARDVVLRSSNANTQVDFAAGTKRIHLTAPAFQLMWSGAQAYMSVDVTAQNFTTATALSWSGTNPDSDSDFVTGTGFWDAGAATRLTLPATGYDQTKVQLLGQVSLANITASDWVELQITFSGTAVARQTFVVPTTTPRFQIRTAMVQAGFSDYFELKIQVGADTSVDVVAADTFFQLEILQ